MKKLLIISLFVVASAAAFGQAPNTKTIQKTVTVNIASYIALSFANNNSIAFNIVDGGKAGTYLSTAAFSVTTNVPYNVSSTVTVPHSTTVPAVNAPGTLTSKTNLDGITQIPGLVAQPGTLTITLSGLDFTTAKKGLYNAGGLTVITVFDAS